MNTSIQSLREKQPAELSEHLLELRKEQFALSMQRISGQQPKPHDIRRVRRDIARVKFLLGQATQGRPQ